MRTGRWRQGLAGASRPFPSEGRHKGGGPGAQLVGTVILPEAAEALGVLHGGGLSTAGSVRGTLPLLLPQSLSHPQSDAKTRPPWGQTDRGCLLGGYLVPSVEETESSLEEAVPWDSGYLSTGVTCLLSS